MHRCRNVLVAILGMIGWLCAPARAQAQMGDMDHSMAGMEGMAGPLGVPMDRAGSGTTWIPDAVPIPSRHVALGSWDVMLHGVGFLQYDRQEGPRGDGQLGSLNWAMLMASHALAGGQLQLRTMLSLDPLTVTDRGYPLLLQTGETHDGSPINDRQHPHDFWMELAVLYERAVSERLGVSLYAAPAGEPALGPVAFMHRPSALDNLAAPLSHHWQDATHISFGVMTGGIFTNRWKLEGSVFNGREPDEHRWGLESIHLDSYSGRLTVNPSAAWSLTAGYGHLESPDGLHPEESLRRATLAALHGRTIGADGRWSSALIWGRNSHSGSGDSTFGVLLESEAILDLSNTLLGRAEYVEKSGHELALPPSAGIDPERGFGVAAFSLGFVRELGRVLGVTGGLGVLGTVNVVPASLEPFYGSRTPLGGFVFLRVRPFHESSTAAMGM